MYKRKVFKTIYGSVYNPRHSGAGGVNRNNCMEKEVHFINYARIDWWLGHVFRVKYSLNECTFVIHKNWFLNAFIIIILIGFFIIIMFITIFVIIIFIYWCVFFLLYFILYTMCINYFHAHVKMLNLRETINKYI